MGFFGDHQKHLNRKLLRAVRSGDFRTDDKALDAARKALAAGADVNAVDDEGKTALYRAIGRGYTQAALFLIDQSADVHAVAVLYAAVGDEDVFNKLFEKGFTLSRYAGSVASAVERAARVRNPSFLERLLDAGADVNMITDVHDGQTILHHAAACGNFSTVKMLLKRGADPTLRDTRGDTPASIAVKKCEHGIADFIRAFSLLPLVNVWSKVSDDEVSRLTESARLGYSTLEVFNFRARKYTQVMRNLGTNAESQAVKFFSEGIDMDLAEAAYAAFTRAGGVAEKPSVHATFLSIKPRLKQGN